MSTAGELGEHEVIRRISAILSDEQADALGDDCAVVAAADGLDMVLTTDTVIAGTHFDDTATAGEIGHKAAGRVLSDIGAMGATPKWILTDLVAPSALAVAEIEAIYRSARDLCARFEARIIGGDTAAGDSLQLHVFGVGVLPTGTALLRSGAQSGDAIFVTGALGGSRSGHHLNFTPRVAEGRWLREQGLAHAAIDVSDGLAGDLHHLLQQSKMGAELELGSIPLTASCDSVAAALSDGEDYELLFTGPAARAATLLAHWPFERVPLHRIGTITEDKRLVARDTDGTMAELPPIGYEHFRNH